MGVRASVGVAVVAILGTALIACGGGDREVTADDLPTIVLQREDVPIGEIRQATVNQGSALAVYGHEFEVAPEDAVPGDLVCVSSVVSLHRDSEAARDAFASALQEFDRLQRDPNVGALQVSRVTAPNIGTDAAAFRLVSPIGDFCTSYRTQPFDQHILYIYDGNVIAIITNVNLASGSSFDETERLAEIQDDRLQRFRSGDLPSPESLPAE